MPDTDFAGFPVDIGLRLPRQNDHLRRFATYPTNQRNRTLSGSGRSPYFLDYQIGRYVVADALRNAGATVEVHIDHFAQPAPDLEWIPEVGKRRWVLITRDANIRRNPVERAAYEAAGLRGFVVTGKELGGLNLPRSWCAACGRW